MIRYYDSVTETLDFGRYKDYTIVEVLCQNPSYIHWCINNITGFYISESLVDEIQENFPDFIIQYNFKEHIFSKDVYSELLRDSDDWNDNEWYDDYCFSEDVPTYERYSGSYAQDEMGYSDDEIDTIFDGDPCAYWNVD